MAAALLATLRLLNRGAIYAHWQRRVIDPSLKILPSQIFLYWRRALDILGFGVIGTILIAMRFLDWHASPGQTSSYLAVDFGLLPIVYSVILTHLGYT